MFPISIYNFSLTLTMVNILWPCKENRVINILSVLISQYIWVFSFIRSNFTFCNFLCPTIKYLANNEHSKDKQLVVTHLRLFIVLNNSSGSLQCTANSYSILALLQNVYITFHSCTAYCTLQTKSIKSAVEAFHGVSLG